MYKDLWIVFGMVLKCDFDPLFLICLIKKITRKSLFIISNLTYVNVKYLMLKRKFKEVL